MSYIRPQISTVVNYSLDEVLGIDDPQQESLNIDQSTYIGETKKQLVISKDFSNLCEIYEPFEKLVIQRKPRGRPRGSLTSKPVQTKKKIRIKQEIPDYSHVDSTIIPDDVLDPLKMTIYSYQAHVSDLIVDPKILFDLLEPTIDSNKNIYALHCNYGHKINSFIVNGSDETLKNVVNKKKSNKNKKKTRKPVGDGTCFNTCIEIYIKIDHPGLPADKFYKMKCSSTTGEIQIPGGRDESKEDCRKVVNLFLDHLKKYNICINTAMITNDKVSMKNYKTRINIEQGLDLCTNKFSKYFYDIEYNNLDTLEGVYIKPPFAIKESKNPDECSKTSFKFQYGDGKKESFRVEIFNNEKKIKVGRINFKGTKVHLDEDGIDVAIKAYNYIGDVIRENWSYFIIKQPTITADNDDESSSDEDD